MLALSRDSLIIRIFRSAMRRRSSTDSEPASLCARASPACMLEAMAILRANLLWRAGARRALRVRRPADRGRAGETWECPVCVKNLELRGAWRVGEDADLRLCEGFGWAAVRRRCKTPGGGSSTSPQLRILNRNSRFPCSRPPLSPQFQILNRVRLRPLAGRPSLLLAGGEAVRATACAFRGEVEHGFSSHRNGKRPKHIMFSVVFRRFLGSSILLCR